MTESIQIRPDPDHFGQIRSDFGHFCQMWLDQWPNPSRFGLISGWIHPNPAGSQPFWPDPTGFGQSDRILAILARFGLNLVNPTGFWPFWPNSA
jgi:hypothetical protein